MLMDSVARIGLARGEKLESTMLSCEFRAQICTGGPSRIDLDARNSGPAADDGDSAQDARRLPANPLETRRAAAGGCRRRHLRMRAACPSHWSEGGHAPASRDRGGFQQCLGAATLLDELCAGAGSGESLQPARLGGTA